jgi:hypothetical protein
MLGSSMPLSSQMSLPLSIVVSDDEGCPLFRAALYFEIEDLVPSTL